MRGPEGVTLFFLLIGEGSGAFAFVLYGLLEELPPIAWILTGAR